MGKKKANAKQRIVYRGKDGKWREKAEDASRAGSVHDTQKDAAETARDKLQRSGGGELTIKGRDGKFRSKDTIAPGNDPNPPKDTEH